MRLPGLLVGRTRQKTFEPGPEAAESGCAAGVVAILWVHIAGMHGEVTGPAGRVWR